MIVSRTINNAKNRVIYRETNNGASITATSKVYAIIYNIVHNAIYGEISSAVRRSLRSAVHIALDQPQPPHIKAEVNRIVSELR